MFDKPLYTIVDPATLCQCTGLVAAKSYRGDSEDDRLLFEWDTFRLIGNKYTVAWVEGSACFMAYGFAPLGDTAGNMEIIPFGRIGINSMDAIEIIGTIYDEEG